MRLRIIWVSVAVLVLLSKVSLTLASSFVRVDSGEIVSDGGWSFGVSWVDYDGDSYPDIFVSNDVFRQVGELNYFYHNNGDGSYTRVRDGAIATEGSSVGSTAADFDNDGDIDIFVACFAALDYLYVNNGDGTFTKAPTGPLGSPNEGTMEAEWVDCNNDGLLELFVVNHRPPRDSTPILCNLYANRDGSFEVQNVNAIGLTEDEGNSIAWGDYDNDGDRDLFWSRNDKLTLFFVNNGDMTFTQDRGISISRPPAKYHGNWADYDNDGDLDLYTIAGDPGTAHLLKNAGNGTLVPVTGQPICLDTGYFSGGYWGDYDNDGWQDLFVVGHKYYEPQPNRLYRNNGDGTFSRVTEGPVATDAEPSSSAAWADHDRDGDLDLLVGNVNNANNTLYENEGNANNWIQVELTGTRSNRSGIGAKVRVKANLAGGPVWQMREISAKNGFMSQSELVAHFGLGDASVVDSLIVEWPGGDAQVMTDAGVNQYLKIVEQSPARGNTTGGNDDMTQTVSKEMAEISKIIHNSIGWAKNKDKELSYSCYAKDAELFWFSPKDQGTLHGFEAFVELTDGFFMLDDFKAIRFEVRDLTINLSRSGDVAWYHARLDDYNEWKGQPANWEDVRWTGVLEKREGHWVIVQMHFSEAAD